MTRPGLVDSHCHLTYDYAPKSAQDLVREAELAGVNTLITVGVDIATLPQNVSLSEQFNNVFHTVGIHPHEASTLKEGDLALLENASHHEKCRGIGEIGLDYHYDLSPRETQKHVFEKQLELASRRHLPAVIHCREAEEDMLGLLKRFANELQKNKTAPGIIHCFTGTRGFGEACLEMGFFIAFSGIVTFKTATDLQNCAKSFPLDRLLVETDAPYLAPIPFRGKRCEPAMVASTAKKLAELRGIPFDEIVRTTTANASRVFGL